MSDSFDPANYITKIRGGAEYLEVKWRLKWLRRDDPHATIVTDHVTLNSKLALFRCRITLSTGGVATAYGSETPGDFGDYIEKAETKAIGRALHNLGYGTQYALTPSESEADHLVAEPVRRETDGMRDVRRNPPAPPKPEPPDVKATPEIESLRRKMWALARKLTPVGNDPQEMWKAIINAKHGHPSTKKLNALQLRTAITWLETATEEQFCKEATKRGVSVIRVDRETGEVRPYFGPSDEYAPTGDIPHDDVPVARPEERPDDQAITPGRDGEERPGRQDGPG